MFEKPKLITVTGEATREIVVSFPTLRIAVPVVEEGDAGQAWNYHDAVSRAITRFDEVCYQVAVKNLRIDHKSINGLGYGEEFEPDTGGIGHRFHTLIEATVYAGIERVLEAAEFLLPFEDVQVTFNEWLDRGLAPGRRAESLRNAAGAFYARCLQDGLDPASYRVSAIMPHPPRRDAHEGAEIPTSFTIPANPLSVRSFGFDEFKTKCPDARATIGIATRTDVTYALKEGGVDVEQPA